MYTSCQDSHIDSIKSPLCTSTALSNASFLLNSIPEAIVIISDKGIILEINSATSRVFGWTKDEIINRKNINFLLSNRDGEKLMSIINNEELSTFIDSSYHCHGLNKNGTTFPCDINFGIFPKNLLDNSSINDSSNTIYIAVISTNKKNYRTSDSVIFDLKSRYQNEYEEIEALGKGGFGQVFKARNRLDGQLYAIKKIKLQSKPKDFTSSFDLQTFENLKPFNSNHTSPSPTLSFLSAEDLRIVREVKTFARISNHPNIVRYHASWIEVEEKIKKNRNLLIDGDSFDDSSSEEGLEGIDELDEDEYESSLSYESSQKVQIHSLGHNSDSNYDEKEKGEEEEEEENDDDEDEEDNDSKNHISNNDFIISFSDSKENVNIDSQNFNSNDYLIDMNNLDSVRSENNVNKNDNDPSDDENSYNPFSFTISDDPLINKNQKQEQNQNQKQNQKQNQSRNQSRNQSQSQSQSQSHSQSKIRNFLNTFNSNTDDSFDILPKKNKNKILEPINTSLMRPLEKKNNLKLYLIIQMELCSGQTLETWIRERNELMEKKEVHIDRRVVFKIFKQIVQAVAHVHWNGCIHRDVKPANVFVQNDNHILLGDFGLAKDVDFSVSTPKSGTIPPSTTFADNLNETKDGDISGHPSHFHKLTSGVGTFIYASPEQLASSQCYDNKTDIYSLGILLFELLWPFRTGMERIKTLTDIRNGKFPEDFVEKWPLELPLLRSLLNPDPALRPTAQEILDSEVLNVNYITPLYNNPTNLLSALDLRINHVSIDPNESIIKERRKSRTKTLSSSSKLIKNYGDCGACKQKDKAISSFKNQFLKTKKQIAQLEDSVAQASKRVWLVSTITFIFGCLITLCITLLIVRRDGGFYSTSNIENSKPSNLNVRANLNTNDSNFDVSAFVPEIPEDKTHLPRSNIPVIDTVEIDESKNNDYLIQNPSEKIISNKFLKKNVNKSKRNTKIEDNNILPSEKDFVVTQTLSLNYYYKSKSRTITITKTKTSTINFETATTSTYPLDNSTPTV